MHVHIVLATYANVRQLTVAKLIYCSLALEQKNAWHGNLFELKFGISATWILAPMHFRLYQMEKWLKYTNATAIGWYGQSSSPFGLPLDIVNLFAKFQRVELLLWNNLVHNLLIFLHFYSICSSGQFAIKWHIKYRFKTVLWASVNAMRVCPEKRFVDACVWVNLWILIMNYDLFIFKFRLLYTFWFIIRTCLSRMSQNSFLCSFEAKPLRYILHVHIHNINECER